MKRGDPGFCTRCGDICRRETTTAPTPWRLGYEGHKTRVILDANGEWVCKAGYLTAQMIVDTVNAKSRNNAQG